MTISTRGDAAIAASFRLRLPQRCHAEVVSGSIRINEDTCGCSSVLLLAARLLGSTVALARVRFVDSDPTRSMGRTAVILGYSRAMMRPPFAKLTKAVVIFVTAVCGNANATAPDRILDETVQLNASDSPVAVKSERRSGERAQSLVAGSHDHRGERMDPQRAGESPVSDSRAFQSPSDHYTMPHTLFGAGNSALSALGNGAPTSVLRF